MHIRLHLIFLVLGAAVLVHACTSQPSGVKTPPAVKDGHDAAPLGSEPHLHPTVASRSRHTEPPSLLDWRARDVTCYVSTGHRTASGVWPHEGMAASNLYPFGTRLRIENVGVVTVSDRIGHGSDVDLFFSQRHACINFGRRHLRVAVVR